jgi:hypothetical protein
MMASNDFDDPTREEQWIRDERSRVEDYLKTEGVSHLGVAGTPSWHVAPYLAIWEVFSKANPTAVGWWVVSGDVPTDYVSSADAHSAREAMRVFSMQWSAVAARMEAGKPDPETRIGSPSHEKGLAPLLSKRARLLREIVDDDDNWADNA